MNGFLVDTNVLSEFGRTQQPHVNVKRWLEATDSRSLFASVVTWGELRKGIQGMAAGKRRDDLERWLEYDLREWVRSPPLACNQNRRRPLGNPCGPVQVQGGAITMADGIIVATALEHGLTVTTRNVRDFAGLGLGILNFWE